MVNEQAHGRLMHLLALGKGEGLPAFEDTLLPGQEGDGLDLTSSEQPWLKHYRGF